MSAEPPEPPWQRSLDVILEEVRVEREAQLQHFDSLDAKAGIVLGFAGALVALAPRNVNWVVDMGRFVAIVGALVALMAFWPRIYPATELRVLRDRYLASFPVFTRRTLMDTQIVMIEGTGSVLRQKARWLKVAMGSLGCAALLVAIGVTL